MCLLLSIAFLLLPNVASAQADPPSVQGGSPPHPRDIFGFTPGDDHKLANYTQLQQYYRALDAASGRVKLFEIGQSVRGRPLLLLAISSEDNIRQLDRWKDISTRLARVRGVSEEEAQRFAKEGKAVVFIENGLHSTEVAHAQHASLLAHKIATEESEEVRRIRENVVLLLMPVMNPDGQDMVVEWYRRNLGTPFETAGLPGLYHHFLGHDNNRDWAMLTQPETRAVSRVLYHEWHPQILYSHHQTAPFPARISIAPFDDPVDPNIHPLIVRSVSAVGTHMAKRFEEEKKPGVISRLQFTMWRADGPRYAGYGHNIVGVHSETAHASASPAFHHPDSLPTFFGGRRAGAPVSTRQPSIFYANPWQGGWARLGEAVDYMITGSMGALDIAARLKEDWLHNIYRVGRHEIEKGEAGSPFAYVIPTEQWDAGEAWRLLDVLRQHNVEVHQATAPFTVDGRQYPAGSHIIFAGQPFRPLLRILLERQDYPEMRASPEGAPLPPYDMAGWTFPIGMGVNMAIVDQPFQAQVRQVIEVRQPAGTVSENASFGYLLTRRANASTLAVNRLLAQGDRVSWTAAPLEVGGQRFDAGTFLIENRRGTDARVRSLAEELGLDFAGVAQRPSVQLQALRQPRVGLYKGWVANMQEGWARWLLQQEYGFAVDTLHNDQIRRGNLSRYDVIVLPAQSTQAILDGHAAGRMPEQFVGGIGTEGVQALRRFVERGGRLVALDRATDFAIEQFGLPVRAATAALPPETFFIPGSLIRLQTDPVHPLAHGMPEETAAFFVEVGGTRSRGFEIVEGDGRPVEVAARWGDRDLLLSGFALGADEHLAGKPAVVRVGLGRGDVVLIGFSPYFRAYSPATYKLLFNAVHGASTAVPRTTLLEDAATSRSR